MAIWPSNPTAGHTHCSVQFSHSVVSNSLWPHEPQHARPPCPSPTPRVHPKPCPLNLWCHLTISSCHPRLLLPSIFPSISFFSNKSDLRIRWPKYWSFSFNIRPSNEHPGLISFRMDWLDLLAVQRALNSLLQHHSSKASILWHSAFLIIQLSYPCITTGKTIALTRRTFVNKVMSLLFNMLSRLVITFLPRSKHLLISWLQSASVVILESPKIKSDTVSTVSPSICHEVMGPDAVILVFWKLSFKPTFSLCSFAFIKRLFSSSLSAKKCVVICIYKQGDNIQPWRTPFPFWNQCVVPCPVLTVASWPAFRFLKRQVRWSVIPISFRNFHTHWGNQNWRRHMFIVALFTAARTWKQSRCPSADEWIRKLWYTYTMEYYSTIQKNAFESNLNSNVDKTEAYYTEWSNSERETAVQY